ncbi:2-dehydropantoate 2-reductase [Hazenella sp. IB182357]|uniref:2-dehydropantoate 2-reductase n=1 Tax=Polycladospora coralii TaxID=2771432 RepID=A0A926RT38_9BACL|nr:2-dehydropantoate 2-reductase [Polycladospora coralii]MBD1372315.1 2-dehydropantoate 2-reductase [Polycladospora coralii]MBS7531495.1 2-dehydropantoate 2-reductase [Polycladospora coralii]
MISKDKKIVIVGAGAIGGTLGAWLTPQNENVYMLDRGEVAERIRESGITVFAEGRREHAETIPVKTITDISEIPNVDIIILAVKNYSLDQVATHVRNQVEGEPIIVALQNGVENQEILPKYFKNIIYGVVGYNAWLEEPATIGYQSKGPYILGTLHPELTTELAEVEAIFKRGVETIVTDHFQDAAYSKMIINLTNSFTTLVGHKYREITDFLIFKKILTNLLYEGVQIVKATGYKECKIGDMPSWFTITSIVKLPQFVTNGAFRKNLAKMVLSSMGQDIIQRQGTESELDSLNGYFIKLADQAGLAVPYNRAIYQLCKEQFSKTPFKPLTEREVWERIRLEMEK